MRAWDAELWKVSGIAVDGAREATADEPLAADADGDGDTPRAIDALATGGVDAAQPDPRRSVAIVSQRIRSTSHSYNGALDEVPDLLFTSAARSSRTCRRSGRA
jgi:hypothetical protein